MATTKSNHPFSADRPITSRTDDVLGRAVFADALATAIRGWLQKDSLVLALYGPWGIGKSSVKNLVLESLRSTKSTVRVVEFNPWQWAAQEQLAEAFFHEVDVVLGHKDDSKEMQRRAAKWREYAAYLKVGATALTGVRTALPVILTILGGLGILAGLTANLGVRTVLVVVGVLFVVLAALLAWSAKFAEALTGAFTVSAEVRRRGLTEVKKELGDLLAALNEPILVVIDDVDRLTQDEARLVFQLVKANADFPNLVYLLLLDRGPVERSLEEVYHAAGRQFLEKVVQVGFDLPALERVKLERVLFEGLDRLLDVEGVRSNFDQTRWANIFVPGLRPYFENLRDIHRYLGMLSFHLGLFRVGNRLEVNSIDLIGLEALRVFEPGLYNSLPPAKATLTQTGAMRQDTDATRRAVDDLLSKTDEATRPAARETLRQLFPPIASALGGPAYSADWSDRWYRELRVCHPDVFDRYFHFAIPEGDISQEELDQILSHAGDRDALVTDFNALKARGLLVVILDRLEAYKEHIDLEHAEPFVTALFDIGDDLPSDNAGIFGIDPDMHAIRIIHWYLKREPDVRRRADLLERAIRVTVGLYLPVMKVSIESSRKSADSGTEFLVEESDLPSLQALCVAKIKAAAENGRLAAHPKLPRILYRWLEWGNPDDVRKWVGTLISSDQGFLQFVTAFTQPVRIQGLSDYSVRTRSVLDLDSIQSLVDPTELERRLGELKENDLRQEQARAVEALHAAIKNRREGKSTSALADDEI